MKLKIKKLRPAAIVPQYASSGAACFDLHAIDDGTRHPNDDHAVHYKTGLAFEVPAGFVLLIFSRSGHGFKSAMRLSNCVGVIDSDYRGEVQVSLRFDASGDWRCPKVRSGDRVAQAMLAPIPQVEFEVVDELSDTERGAGGFGSTGTGDLTGQAFIDAHLNRLTPLPEKLVHGSTPGRELSDREWAAMPANLREGCTVHVPGVGDL